MTPKRRSPFKLKSFLTTAGYGRDMMRFKPGMVIFAQGDASDYVFIVQTGLVILSTLLQGNPKTTRSAIVAILGKMDFVGNEALAGETRRPSSALALTDCQLLRIEKTVMMSALAREVTLSNALCDSLLALNIRHQQELADQRCMPSEKRLARILLRIAHLDGQSSPETKALRISQQTLAGLIGTTRSRVSHFMFRFKQTGLIEYTGKRHPRVTPALQAFLAS